MSLYLRLFGCNGPFARQVSPPHTPAAASVLASVAFLSVISLGGAHNLLRLYHAHPNRESRGRPGPIFSTAAVISNILISPVKLSNVSRQTVLWRLASSSPSCRVRFLFRRCTNGSKPGQSVSYNLAYYPFSARNPFRYDVHRVKEARGLVIRVQSAATIESRS
jgi:hypothetical protein